MLTQVLHQMVAVGDLGGMWEGAFRRICVGAGPVSADDFNFRVTLQPGQDGFRRAVRQEIERLTGLQIDQNGAVAVPPPQRLGKGNGVTAIPSPKNRAGMFPCTRLKPFMTPV